MQKLDYDQTEESFLNNKAVPPQAQTQVQVEILNSGKVFLVRFFPSV